MLLPAALTWLPSGCPLPRCGCRPALRLSRASCWQCPVQLCNCAVVQLCGELKNKHVENVDSLVHHMADLKLTHAVDCSCCREMKVEYLESVDGMVGNYEVAIEEKTGELKASWFCWFWVDLLHHLMLYCWGPIAHSLPHGAVSELCRTGL